jgi:hypothetical protein
MKTLIYKSIVLLFYYLGDIFSKIDSEFAATLYQKCMNVSVKYDEKIDFYFWKSVNNQ